MSAEQVELWTADKLKQYLQNEKHWANRFNDRVRLAKRLLVDAGKPDLADLVAEETEEPSACKAPQVDELSTIGPGSTVVVCRWVSWGGGQIYFESVFVTHRSGDEFCGNVTSGYFDDNERITFELKHICYVENEGADETRTVLSVVE